MYSNNGIGADPIKASLLTAITENLSRKIEGAREMAQVSSYVLAFTCIPHLLIPKLHVSNYCKFFKILFQSMEIK